MKRRYRTLKEILAMIPVLERMLETTLEVDQVEIVITSREPQRLNELLEIEADEALSLRTEAGSKVS